MDLDRGRRAVLRLAPDAGSPRRARDFLADACRRWDASRFLEPGGLVVSELVTNAVRHAGTDILLGLVLTGDGDGDGSARALTVTVRDGGPGLPHVVPPEERGLGGRGLAMVDKLAEVWGVDADEHGKSVWCRLEEKRSVVPDRG